MSHQDYHFDASRSLTALEQDGTIIAVIEMSQSKWLVAALVPGVERHPLKNSYKTRSDNRCLVERSGFGVRRDQAAIIFLRRRHCIHGRSDRGFAEAQRP